MNQHFVKTHTCVYIYPLYFYKTLTCYLSKAKDGLEVTWTVQQFSIGASIVLLMILDKK